MITRRVQVIAALVLVAAGTVLPIVAPAPNENVRSLLALHDYGHVLDFGMIALVVALLLRAREGSMPTRIGRLAAAFAIAVVLGIAVELVQTMTPHGDPDVGDVMRDAGGAVAALLLLASSWPASRRATRLALGAAALATAVLFLTPTLAAWRDEREAERSFPVLVDFRSASQVDRFARAGSAPMALEAGHLRVDLPPGPYPGVTLRYFPRDWRGRRTLVITCANRSTAPLEVTVRVDDLAHDEQFTDRFNRAFTLAPGENTIEIPLADVERAPRGRTMDMAHVRSIVIFAWQLDHPATIALSAITLR